MIILIILALFTLILSIAFLLLKKKNPIIISIDGNIGSGKSTLINILKEELKYDENILFLDEPVDEWLKINDGHTNILDYFYKDKKRWSYTFQNLAFITRSKLLINAVKKNKTHFFQKRKIIISERSIETDKNIFAKMLYDEKDISEIEYKIYDYWYNMKLHDINVKNVIYLRTTPNDSFDRILKRGRVEESDLKYEYIQTIHNYHDKWLVDGNNCNICYLNGKDDFLNNKEIKNNIIKSISVFIHSLQSRLELFP